MVSRRPAPGVGPHVLVSSGEWESPEDLYAVSVPGHLLATAGWLPGRVGPWDA